ncbi:MAG: hypothetical protein JWM09_244 [Francisellaceae bacterium]|nr:hypothetical protein [Francisellaceae bacterium]
MENVCTISDPTKAQSIVKGGIYRHYKNKLYQVLYTACHSETYETMVVYQALYNCERFGEKAIWTRPLNLFIDQVEINGIKQARFQFISS